jgi:hypothetical protein
LDQTGPSVLPPLSFDVTIYGLPPEPSTLKQPNWEFARHVDQVEAHVNPNNQEACSDSRLPVAVPPVTFDGRGKHPPFTLQTLERLYGMPISLAAKVLGVGQTSLKRECRKLGINRWPFRKLKSMRKVVARVLAASQHPEDQNFKLAQKVVDYLKADHKRLRSDPTLKMDDVVCKIRQAIFKQDHMLRQHSGSLIQGSQHLATDCIQ